MQVSRLMSLERFRRTSHVANGESHATIKAVGEKPGSRPSVESERVFHFPTHFSRLIFPTPAGRQHRVRRVARRNPATLVSLPFRAFETRVTARPSTIDWREN